MISVLRARAPSASPGLWSLPVRDGPRAASSTSSPASMTMTAPPMSTAKSSTSQTVFMTRPIGCGRCRCVQEPPPIWTGSITCWLLLGTSAAVAGVSGSPPVARCATSPMRPLRPMSACGLDSSAAPGPFPVVRSRHHLLRDSRTHGTDRRQDIGQDIDGQTELGPGRCTLVHPRRNCPRIPPSESAYGPHDSSWLCAHRPGRSESPTVRVDDSH